MNRRLFTAVVFGLGLWLWPADGTAVDSMSGGGVSSSGSQPWIGGHNNLPRQTLSPVGTVFTPPTSFGNYWILNNAASQTVACPPDIADGDSMNIHIQYGAGAPYSPAIAFSVPCYGWTSGVQPTWSEAPTRSDSAFCQSMNPPDVSGASFVCAPQLNVKPPAGAPSVVQAKFGSKITSGTSIPVTMTSPMTAGHTMACLVVYNGSGTVSVSDGTTSYTALDGPGVLGSGKVETFYLLSVVGSPTVVTATATSAVTFAGIECMEVSGATVIDSTGHVLNPLSVASTAADAVTSGNVTTTNPNELLLGLSINTQPIQVNAGTGETLVIQDTSNAAYGAGLEYKTTGAAGTYASTFTSTTAVNVNYGTAAIAIH